MAYMQSKCSSNNSTFSSFAVIFDESKWHLECSYPREDIKTVVYETSSGMKNVSDFGQLPVEMAIFNAQYTAKLVPIPAIFKLGARVHVQVSLMFEMATLNAQYISKLVPIPVIFKLGARVHVQVSKNIFLENTHQKKNLSCPNNKFVFRDILATTLAS